MEDKNEGGSDSADGQQPPPTPPIPESSAPGSQNAATQRGQKPKISKDQLDRDLVRWTRVLAFFTGALVLAAGLQFRVMHGQLKEMRATRISGDKAMAAQMAVMQGQLDQMQIGERPWITISSITGDSIQVGEDGALINAYLIIKNIGHSPAENIYSYGEIFAEMDMTDERKAAETICKHRITHRLDFLKTVVFPGETQEVDSGLAPINFIDVKKQVDASFAIQPTFIRKKMLSLPLRSGFTAIGCVTYSFGSRAAQGATAFAFEMYRRCPFGPVGECAFSMTKFREFGAADIVMTRTQWGLFAN